MAKKLWNTIALKLYENILVNIFMLLIIRGFQTVDTLKMSRTTVFFTFSDKGAKDNSNFKEKHIISWRIEKLLLQ